MTRAGHLPELLATYSTCPLEQGNPRLPNDATARVAYAAYAAGAASNPWLGYTMLYPLTPRWRLLHMLRGLHLDKNIVESSLAIDERRKSGATVA